MACLLRKPKYTHEVSKPPQTLVGMNREEIAAFLGERPGARMRTNQLAIWAYKKAALTYEEMTDLPAALKEELSRSLPVQPLIVSRHARSTDGVDKLLVHNGDNQVYECVLLPYEDRVSCCISSQVGCPMGCTFCATGLGGFDRNLTAGEIVGQYLQLQRVRRDNLLLGRGKGSDRISHVVFMGMGEPLLNLKNVVKALNLLHDEVGLSYRHLTVSTVGLVPQILELADLNLPIHLALSLHSPDDEIRGRMMPVNKKWPVKEVMEAMKTYGRKTGRKITIEYLLIGELTDTPSQAADLARLIRGVPSVVNVIPFNYVATEEGFKRPTRERVRAFKAELKKHGVNFTERMERGHDIAAACGQLAGQHPGKFARRGHELTVIPS
jgi:23S rRNA (adenine2503-C2)-methyltransferase